MKLSHPIRLAIAVLALFSLLFTQLALASYVCPGQKRMDMGHKVVASMDHGDAMPGCAGMDTNQTGLCHANAHQQPAKQSLDKPDVPSVQPFVAVGLVVALDLVNVPIRSPVVLTTSALLERSTAPPISIRNCCFRI